MANAKSSKIGFSVAAILVLIIIAAGTYHSYQWFIKQSNGKKARTAFTELRKSEDGKKAESLVAEIKSLCPNKKMPVEAWLKFVGVADSDELSKFTQEAYWKEGTAAVNELQALSANPARAIELRTKIFNAQAGSKQAITAFGTSAIEVNQRVAMNKLKDAARDGQFTAENLLAAGVLRRDKIALKMPATFAKKTDLKKPAKHSKVKVASLKQ